MLNPIFNETDSARKGDTYLRRYNTGTLDTSTMTPRARLLRRRDGQNAGEVQMARLKLSDNSPDPYNFALVIPYSVTSTLDPYTVYQITVSFDDENSNSIPHGCVTLTVLQGEAHP